jgi:hypothetical protein
MSSGQNFGYVPTQMTPDAVLGGCIEIYENVWTDCDKIIQDTEIECANVNSGVNWNKATTIGDGIYQNMRTNFDLGITFCVNAFGNPLMRNLHNRLNELMVSVASSYHRRYGVHESFWQEGYNMLKYRAGQEYKAHYDSATGGGRHISVIMYLNNDYTGGEIEFPHFKVKIKPEPGMLILFPSNFAYTHIAHPVTSGTKYAIVTWLHDRPI